MKVELTLQGVMARGRQPEVNKKCMCDTMQFTHRKGHLIYTLQVIIMGYLHITYLV